MALKAGGNRRGILPVLIAADALQVRWLVTAVVLSVQVGPIECWGNFPPDPVNWLLHQRFRDMSDRRFIVRTRCCRSSSHAEASV